MGLSSFIAELCNGSTYDSDSYCLGSNPSSAAKKELRQAGSFCIQIRIITAFQEKLQALLGELGEAAVEQGILAAVEHGARNFAYVQTVAKNYVSGNSKKQNAGAGYSSMDLVNELYGDVGGEGDAATAENSPNDC